MTPSAFIPVTGRRRRPAVLPGGTRELSTLAHIDYQDAFLVGAGLARDATAEQ